MKTNARGLLIRLAPPGVLLILALGLVSMPAQVVLDDTWTLSVAGQTVQVNPDGSFLIPNIAAPDQFGPGGPGTRPDFLSDDFLRVVGFSTVDGVTRYVFSEPFQIRQGEPFVVTNLTLTLTPPPFPEAIRAVPDEPTLTQIGQTTQVRVTGTLIGGSLMDLTPRTAWTIYRTSNPDIATVDPDGVVTAVGRGMVFITAINEAATSVAQVDVSPGDPLTTVTGIVMDENGQPVEGITITLIGVAGTATTDAEGRFSIPGVATAFGIQGVIARTTGPTATFGIANSPTVVPGGFTDAGIITAIPCEQLGIDCVDSDNDCLPDSVEIALGLNPNLPDTDGDGVFDGEEDSDGDGLTNCAEVILGTDPARGDTDGDGLSDGMEVTQLRTDPTRVDTDGDGLDDGAEVDLGTNPLAADSDLDLWNDESEVTGGSDPLDPESTPPLMIVSGPSVSVGLPNFGTFAGLTVSLTVAAPRISVGLPTFDDMGMLAAGTIIARPSASVGLPSFDDAFGLGAGLTVAQPPVAIGLPSFDDATGLGAGTTVAQPRVSLGLPAFDDSGALASGTTIAQPPVLVELPGP
ncbi:MAG TPA: carboxypeptidase regulatory-like domain-containing protein [Methylomirabilota bacterium]|nr:carboxypeptidase regulatory-like domain-containing protein [Methylomirabilota bacterium]